MHLSSIKINKNINQEESNDNADSKISYEEKDQEFESNSRIVNQIKNVVQEEKQKSDAKPEIKATKKN